MAALSQITCQNIVRFSNEVFICDLSWFCSPSPLIKSVCADAFSALLQVRAVLCTPEHAVISTVYSALLSLYLPDVRWQRAQQWGDNAAK